MATPTRTHPGCLILFSLPFLGIGLFMAGLILWDVADALRMMGWRSVPATITQMELVQHRSSKGGRTYAVEATYRYTWEGQPHSASRVAINRSADSFSFWTTLHDDLERQRREDRVTCWVNPGDPSQAVLHRELRWEVLGFKAVFAVVFGGIGGFLGIGSWVGYRRGLARDRLRAADPDSIWREDPRWRGPRIAAGQGGLITCVVLTLAAGAAYLGVTQIPLPGTLPNVLLGVMALPLLILAKSTFHHLQRRLQEGRWHLTPPAMPLVQGATCRVVVDARCPPVGSTTLRWVLTCGERVSRGSGKSSSVTTEERWSHRGSLEVHQGRHVGSSWQVALDLPLPVDLPPTDPDAGIAWELTLEPVGGTGAIAFPLPVVAAQGPGPHLTRAEVASTTELHAGDTLAAAGLHLATTRQGLRITKAAGQGSTLPWASLGGSLVVACLLGLVLVHLLDTKGWQMPTYILAVIVGAISVGHLLLWHSLLQVRILEVDPQGVGLATGLLAAGRSRRWSLDAIRSLDLRSRQSVGNVPHYQIVLTATDGSVTALTPHLGPASQAEAVLTFLDQALGRS